MRVLLTGAFGNLGSLVLDRLIAEGHRTTTLDVATPGNRKVARRYRDNLNVEISWGDIRDRAALAALVDGQNAVIHVAAVIAPFSEENPELAHAVNVGGTKNLLDAIEASGGRPLFVFTSSVSVYGVRQDEPPPRTLDDPLVATDHYSAHKIECEQTIRRRNVPWVILRLGAMIDARMRHRDPRQARLSLRLAANNRVEYVHPQDAATAIVNSLTRPGSHNKVHLIGGGPNCQVTHLQLLNAVSGAFGITFSASDLGTAKLYADWVDTRESERLLTYQQHTFADFRRETYARVRWLRPFVRPFGRLTKFGMKTYLGVH